MDAIDERAGFRFGPFLLSLRPLRLEREGLPIRLRPQALKLLAFFAEHPGSLLTQDEIRRHLWGERHVEFARGIHLIVREIRQALEDDAAKPIYIETIPRQGYRFIAEVAAISAQPMPAWRLAAFRNPAILAGAGMIVLLLAAALLLNVPVRSTHAGAPPSPGRGAYLKGEYLLGKGGARNLAAAAARFHRALTLDHAYAPAHAGLAQIAILKGNFATAEDHARKAVAADPDYAGGYIHLGMIAAERDWNWREAKRLLDKALRLDPASAKAYTARAVLLTILGRHAEALKATDRAYELNPVSALIKADHGWFHYYAGDFDAAARYCAEAAALAPENYAIAVCELKTAAAANDLISASRAAARILRFWKTEETLARKLSGHPSAEALSEFYDWKVRLMTRFANKGEASAEDVATAYADAGEYDSAARLLHEAALAHTPFLPLVLRDPVFEPIHTDPRYRAALAAARIPLAQTL